MLFILQWIHWLTQRHMIIKWHQNKQWFSPKWLDDGKDMTSTTLLIGKLHAVILPVSILALKWGGEGGVGKESCILHHRGVQLRLAYNWAKPAILAAGKGRGGIFISYVSSLSFIFLFLPCSPLSSPLLSLLSLFSLSLETTQNDPEGFEVSLNPNTIKNQIFLVK